jgi:hypothetical protein
MIAPGTRIEITSDAIGVMDTPDLSGRMVEVVARRGTRGRYLGPHPTMEKWAIVALAVDGDVYFAPVAEPHFTTNV